MKKVVFIILALCTLVSCQQIQRDLTRNAVLEMNGNYLYLDEIEQVIPAGLSVADSAKYAESYKKQWIISNLMYQKAKEYYETNGHLKVSWKYVTDDGLKLGYWISMIRKVRKGTVKHSVELTKERIKRLDEIGMIWDCRIEN